VCTPQPDAAADGRREAEFDDAVVGAGIVGLACAFALARRGRRVVVFERDARARGASIRNFGMVWPVGQPPGPRLALALHSRALWLETLAASGIWHEAAGSLHLAYREDEAEVLREFAKDADALGYSCRLLTPKQVTDRSPALRPDGLLAGLWSATETCVDAREVVASLPGWLARAHGVRFEFGAPVSVCEPPLVVAGGRRFRVGRAFVCPGDDLGSLFPEALAAETGLVRSKLQMLRSEPWGGGRRIGPMLAGGLTLRHYGAFESCPTLPALRERVARESPEFDRFGIHVMLSQNGRGELVIGDSHEYFGPGEEIPPFDRSQINEIVMRYLAGFFDTSEVRLAESWHGIYVKHPQRPFVVLEPAPGVTLVTALGGAGMTLSFGLGEELVAAALGERPAALP
jgi:FAD dependent oxidoreductase TIGR03364